MTTCIIRDLLDDKKGNVHCIGKKMLVNKEQGTATAGC